PGEPGGERAGHGAGTVAAGRNGRNRGRLRPATATMPGMPPAPERPILRGEHVWLRPIELADMTEGSIEDADLAHYAGFRRSFSRAEGERFFQKFTGHDENVQFVICRLGNDESIGGVGLREIDRLNGSA